MFCRKCGKEIPDDSRFCQYCGIAIQVIKGMAIDDTITLPSQMAREGTTKTIRLDGMEKPLEVMIPAKIQNGQILALHKVKMIDADGKRIKKDVFLKIIVNEPEDTAE